MTLEQFVVYRSPLDAPGLYVVRRWEITAGAAIPKEAWYAPTLNTARAFVPRHLCRIDRFPDDEPQIVEVWT